tara:strand:+ start:28 stop:1194 length:1167 start_codon:yes stop_codon:yes gene_type:complete
MLVRQISVLELIPYVNNSRTHSDEQVIQIASSIKEFGFTNPILTDGENGIIAGHGRLMAAKKLGLKEVPTIELSHLSEAQKKAYIIADNKLALNSGWDDAMLAIEFAELEALDFDLELTGFSLEEIAAFEVEEIPEGLTDEDAVPELPIEPVTKLGDVWLCGKHRVMCGDSTSIDAVDKLMDGNVCDVGFCDPPYNLGFEYNSYDDNKSDAEYSEFSALWFSNLQIHTLRQIVTLGTKNISVMARLGDVTGVACWVKKNWITSCHIAKLQQWEPIFFFGDFTKHKRTSDLFEINRVYQKDVGDSHTCPKQIALIEDIFSHYSDKSVLDLFGGSGTSLIACEKTNRVNYSMELDPKYCDVIIKRWQDFTGQQATLESTCEFFGVIKDAA